MFEKCLERGMEVEFFRVEVFSRTILFITLTKVNGLIVTW